MRGQGSRQCQVLANSHSSHGNKMRWEIGDIYHDPLFTSHPQVAAESITNPALLTSAEDKIGMP